MRRLRRLECRGVGSAECPMVRAVGQAVGRVGAMGGGEKRRLGGERAQRAFHI